MTESASTTITTNDEWIAGLRAGDTDVMAALRHRIRRGLGVALSGRSDVDDADLDDFTQDSVMRVLERLDTFRGDSGFATWAMAVAIRVSMTALRRRRWAVRPLEDVHNEPASPSVPETHGSAASVRDELLTVLRTAIDQALTPRQRQVLLAELEGVPQVVLADRLSSTPGAIYKTSHDARKKLKVALTRKGFGAETVRQMLADET